MDDYDWDWEWQRTTVRFGDVTCGLETLLNAGEDDDILPIPADAQAKLRVALDAAREAEAIFRAAQSVAA